MTLLVAAALSAALLADAALAAAAAPTDPQIARIAYTGGVLASLGMHGPSA
jgi:hypothetical protein